MIRRLSLLILLLLLNSTQFPFGILAQNNVQGQDKAAVSEEEAENLQDYSREIPVYESEGRRDPFESMVPEEVTTENKIKKEFNYEGAELKGIVNSADGSYALVVDSDGFGHVLREGYRVFGGYVSRVTDNAVYLQIVKYGRSMTIILRIESSKSVIVENETSNGTMIRKPGINIQYGETSEIRPDVVIDNVIIPSADIKTIDEVWFGKAESVPMTNENDEGEGEDTIPTAFTLYDPANDAWISVPHVLNWTKPASNVYGEDIWYTLIIDDNPDYSSPFYVNEDILTSAFLLHEDIPLPTNTELHWKVIARNEKGKKMACHPYNMTFKIISAK